MTDRPRVGFAHVLANVATKKSRTRSKGSLDPMIVQAIICYITLLGRTSDFFEESHRALRSLVTNESSSLTGVIDIASDHCGCLRGAPLLRALACGILDDRGSDYRRGY